MYSPFARSFSFWLHSSGRKHIPTSAGFRNSFLGVIYTTYNIAQHFVLFQYKYLFLNYVTRIYRVIEKSRNPVWYLVLARNEKDEVEFMDEYVGMTV